VEVIAGTVSANRGARLRLSAGALVEVRDRLGLESGRGGRLVQVEFAAKRLDLQDCSEAGGGRRCGCRGSSASAFRSDALSARYECRHRVAEGPDQPEPSVGSEIHLRRPMAPTAGATCGLFPDVKQRIPAGKRTSGV
jgi:hypothetical protein